MVWVKVLAPVTSATPPNDMTLAMWIQGTGLFWDVMLISFREAKGDSMVNGHLTWSWTMVSGDLLMP